MPSTQADMLRPAGQPRDEREPHTRTRRATESVVRTTQRTADGVLRVVHGAERVGSIAHRLRRNATRTVSEVVKPPYAATEAPDTPERPGLSEGVEYRVVYERSALCRRQRQDGPVTPPEPGGQARVVHLAPMKLLLADEEIGLLPLTSSGDTLESAVLLRGSTLLTSMVGMFEELWRLSAPLGCESAEHGEREPEGEPSEEERWILSLLASGATDEAIGRHMGFSSRTAHRRVRELIWRLGVQTRFQAGVRAVKLGWL
ncbi:DNA-binding response regulator [Actinopolyspora mortivallis]|nr:DNA-binding response regulator [Actinopolyspora mortivallis]